MLFGIVLPRQEFAGADLFEAMTELRRTLEEDGAQLLGAGARPEVFPSAMSRQMGGGRKAYSTMLGEPGTDLVDIFDYAAPEAVGSVDQQISFHAKWVESLGQR